jgi:hypothetical protein
VKVRIVSPGWENFTGQMGFGAPFENGVSTIDLTPRVINRLGASLQIVDADTGVQVGPSANAVFIHSQEAPVTAPLAEKVDVDKAEADERERLIKEADERKAAEAEALAAAKAKAEAEAAENAKSVIYTRQELEAIGANDGIDGLRQIASPLGVKGRAIAELVTEILAAQAKAAAE